jgi:hypothetical protein
MSVHKESFTRINNHIPAALRPDEDRGLSRHLEHVNLSQSQILIEPGELTAKDSLSL